MKPPSAEPGVAPEAGGAPTVAQTVQAAQDQRRRALVQGLVGKKVSLSTTDFHHVVGRLVAFGRGQGPSPPQADQNEDDDSLHIFVNNQEVLIRWQGIARIHEADPALAEYLK